MQTDTCRQMTIHHGCEQPARQAASRLQSLLATNQPTLFLSAGGSSLKLLSERINIPTGWSHVTVTTLDERVTDKTAAQNFHQLRETPVMQKHRQQINTIDPLPELGTTPAQAGKRFARKLTQWQNQHESGRIIATVGIGKDGHIAGMIPTSKEVFRKRFQSDKIAVGYKDKTLENAFTERITTTMTFIADHLDHAVAYAVGAGKCSVLTELVNTRADVWSRPAEILKQTPTELFSDCSLSEARS